MLIQYNTFYRRYGVRLPSQMASPPLGRLELLDLPRESIYHYYGIGPTDEGPSERLNPLKNNNRAFSLDTVLELSSEVGSPRRIPLDITRVVREHRIKNVRFRPFKDLASTERDPMSILVVNYAFIPRLYRYQRSYYSTYYSQLNFSYTIWKKMGELATQSDRNQFIEFDLPEVLPSLAQLRMAENNMTQKLAPMFSHPETMAILGIWQWLGLNRKNSFISQVSEERLGRINVIFKESNRWVMFNLGILNSWRAATKEELNANPKANETGEQAARMQARFLRTLMSLFEARTQELPENLGDQDTQVVDDGGTASKSGDQSGNAAVRQTSTDTDPATLQDTAPNEGANVPEMDTFGFEKSFAEIVQDLDQLEEMNQQILAQNQEVEVSLQDPNLIKSKTHEEALIGICNQLAETGALSASEYRRYTENASNYKSIKVGDTTLGELIEVPKELLQITESKSLPDRSAVTDKTMLKSSLLDFDSRYVSQVMQRDIAGMVANLQQAGVLIQDYQVEEVNELTGTYFAYSVKVKPLQGAPSTIRFKIPKINPDGTWVSGKVKYITRKQRGDLPIRKIAPNRVALTSYYGKLFVDRSEKKVNDYGRWLRDAIMASGLDAEDDIVTNLVPGNAFDNKFKAPKLYTTIAFGFRSFKLKIQEEEGKVSDWSLVFDHKARTTLIKQDKLTLLESGGDVVVGLSDDGRIAMMGDSGKLYWVDESVDEVKLVELPSLEEIFKLDAIKAPVDFTELRVLGKNIAMGVVLGYLLGLDKLLKRLQINPRIVPAGQRSNLESGEWSIVFQDESWIFTRDDALASLVMAGWRDFDQTTRQFNVHEFNRRDVYLNVLEENNLGVRFLREMDLANQLFVDPIAKGLLEEMNEPTVFTELLIRSCELLTTDDHPDELDSKFMRIKGYERFSGMLYSELVRSMRVHAGRSNKGLYPLEMNPYAVWIAISDDPAKNQVSDINPIQNLKDQEAVTYSGTGGRMGRSLVKRTRAYHPSDMGVISEATVDSSDVAINTYLSADPQFNSLRGTANKYEIGKTGPTALLSTSALISVGAENDD
jgi:hypothetical protein